jgi:hypothetical protein
VAAQTPGYRDRLRVVRRMTVLAAQIRHGEGGAPLMTPRAPQIPVWKVTEGKLTLGGSLVDREAERTRQRKDLLLHLDVDVAGGTLPHRGSRVVTASAILDALDQRRAMCGVHSVTSLTLHVLMLEMTKSARRILRGGGQRATPAEKSTDEEDPRQETRRMRHGKPGRAHHGPGRWQITHPPRLASAARVGSNPGPCGLIPHPPNTEWHCTQSDWV